MRPIDDACVRPPPPCRAVNTGLTDGLCLVSLWRLPYLVAYSVSCFAGILLSYFLNAFLVFMMASSLRMQAIKATFLSLPAASMRS